MTRPTIYASGNKVQSGSITSDSLSFTVAGGLNSSLLLVCLSLLDNQASNSLKGNQTVKWGGSGGTALTLISGSENERQSNSRTLYTAWFYALAPTAQSSTVYWAVGGSLTPVASSISAVLLQNVDPTSPILTSTGGGSAGGSLTNQDATITAASSDSLVLYNWIVRNGNLSFTVSGATELLDYATGTDTTLDLAMVIAYENGVAGSVTANADWTTSTIRAWSAIEVAGNAASTTGDASITMAAVTPSGTGTSSISATSAPSLAALTVASAAALPLTATASGSITSLTVSATGHGPLITPSFFPQSMAHDASEASNGDVDVEESGIGNVYGSLPYTGLIIDTPQLLSEAKIESAKLYYYIYNASYSSPNINWGFQSGQWDEPPELFSTATYDLSSRPPSGSVVDYGSGLGEGWREVDVTSLVRSALNEPNYDGSICLIGRALSGSSVAFSSFETESNIWYIDIEYEDVSITGTAANTFTGITAAATATSSISGAVTATVAAITATSAGSPSVTGAGSAAIVAITTAIAGYPTASSSGTPALDSLTVSISGSSSIPVSAAISLASVTAEIAGSLPVTGDVGASVSISASAGAEVANSGAAGLSVANVTVSAAAELPLTGDIDATLADITVSGTIVVADEQLGFVVVALDSIGAEATAETAIDSDLQGAFTSLTAASAASVDIIGDVSAELDDLTVYIDVTQYADNTGDVSVGIDLISVAIAAETPIYGGVSAALDGLTVAAIMQFDLTASASIIIDDITMLSYAGSSSFAFGAPFSSIIFEPAVIR